MERSRQENPSAVSAIAAIVLLVGTLLGAALGGLLLGSSKSGRPRTR